MSASVHTTVAQIVAAVADLPSFAAVTLGGSVAAGLADAASDIDLHVYWRAPLATDAERAKRLARVADANSVQPGILTWGLEDHFRVQGRLVEFVYVNLDELAAEVAQGYGAGLSSEGYTTSRLYYVVHGQVLHDRDGAFSALRNRLSAEFPEPTRARLLREYPTLLRYYLDLLHIGQRRDDLLFVQQRRTTIQTIFFNLLFALNRQYHPGEKRLLIHAQRCVLQPPNLATRWNNIARVAADDSDLAERLDELINDLCELIEAHQ